MFINAVTARGFRAGVPEDLTCSFPGRFSLLVGGNNAGKTTVCESLYLAHRHRFPQLPRPSAAALRLAKDGSRELSVQYTFDDDPAAEGPLGRRLLADCVAPPTWTKGLSRSLGRIRVEGVDEGSDQLRLVYLPAHRNPVDELARREADVVVELLRAEQQRQAGHRSLYPLRRKAENLLGQLAADGLIESLELRVQDVMTRLSGGIAHQVPFIGGQAVDDQFLARVLELLLAPQLDRSMGQRLELSGLGYVNLLHIAVTIAAIPDLEAHPAGHGGVPEAGAPVDEHPGDQPDAQQEPVEPTAEEAFEEAREADERSAAVEDSFFGDVFHATVVIEEPEAHLHPQLQHGLIRHLRRVVRERPELQVIISSHASDLIASVPPREIVVLRRTAAGRRSFALAQLPGPAEQVAEALRMAELHLDASRSASLFAERLVLVEGVTDALVLRQLGRHWAGDDVIRRQFIDALTIVPIGCRVGQWPVRLLATTDFELVTCLAVLTDSDNRTSPEPMPPAWVATYSQDRFIYRMNHPTLEPALTLPGNEALISGALADIGANVPDELTPGVVDALFRSKTTDQPAGPAAKAKGEFAYCLGARLEIAIDVVVPAHVIEILDFLFEGLDDDGGEDTEGLAPADGGALAGDEPGDGDAPEAF